MVDEPEELDFEDLVDLDEDDPRDAPPKVVSPPKVEAKPPPKIVLTDANRIEDPRARMKVLCKRTVLAFAAGKNIQCIAGKKIPVPRAAVDDLVRTGCIHKPSNWP